MGYVEEFLSDTPISLARLNRGRKGGDRLSETEDLAFLPSGAIYAPITIQVGSNINTPTSLSQLAKFIKHDLHAQVFLNPLPSIVPWTSCLLTPW